MERMSKLLPAAHFFLAGALAILPATPVRAVEVSCKTTGDSAGWVVATGMDFDGDSVIDVAVSAPCSRTGDARKAGSVRVHSGVDGKRLLVIRGEQADERLGSAIAFIDDLSGDGLPDLIVGSLGFDVPRPGGGTRSNAGRVQVFDRNGNVILTEEGEWPDGNLGESVAALGDVTGDGKADFMVGAGNDRSGPGGDKIGIAYLYSGHDGSLIDFSRGGNRFDEWGRVLAPAGDVDGDNVTDVLVASNLADGLPSGGSSTTQENAGAVQLLSGADLTTVIAESTGEKGGDTFGRSVTMIGDMDGDGIADFAAGAPGTDPSSQTKAGRVEIISSTSERLYWISEPEPQRTAGLGAAVASLGPVDGDIYDDILASAPSATVGTMPESGRVRLFSGQSGEVLWSLFGTTPGMLMGQSLASGPDWNGDGILDAVVGIPGDSPRGRRGAGSARVVSGADGSTLLELNGRRGLETRFFAIGWRANGTPQVRSMSGTGRIRGLRKNVFRRLNQGDFSIAVLDDGSDPDPGEMRVAVSAGHESAEQAVTVLRAGRKGTVVSNFNAVFSNEYNGGVKVSAGDLDDEAGDDIVAVQADAGDGNVAVTLYHRFDTDPSGRMSWLPFRFFNAFTPDSEIEFAGGVTFLIDAQGATAAVGNVLDLTPPPPPEGEEPPEGETFVDRDEIVTGTIGGLPALRVFSNEGVLLHQWQAFPQGINVGTNVATGDLDADGIDEIIAAPFEGQPRIKAFHGDGTPFLDPQSGNPVDFFVDAPPWISGARLTVADVDMDGMGEIIVLPVGSGEVEAFEVDGTAVPTWTTPRPLGPSGARGLALAGTDSYLRHR